MVLNYILVGCPWNRIEKRQYFMGSRCRLLWNSCYEASVAKRLELCTCNPARLRVQVPSWSRAGVSRICCPRLLIAIGAGSFKVGLRKPRICAKFYFRDEILNSKFTVILLVYNLMIRCCKKTGDNYPRKGFWSPLEIWAPWSLGGLRYAFKTKRLVRQQSILFVFFS